MIQEHKHHHCGFLQRLLNYFPASCICALHELAVLTFEHKNVIAWLSLSDDIAPLLERPFIHTFHHISDLVKFQSLQELIFIQGIRDKLLLTGFKQKRNTKIQHGWGTLLTRHSFLSRCFLSFLTLTWPVPLTNLTILATTMHPISCATRWPLSSQPAESIRLDEEWLPVEDVLPRKLYPVCHLILSPLHN